MEVRKRAENGGEERQAHEKEACFLNNSQLSEFVSLESEFFL